MKKHMVQSVIRPASYLSAQQKAGLLVAGIKDKVRLYTENYHTLIQYFTENKLQYKDILRILNAYSKPEAIPSFSA